MTATTNCPCARAVPLDYSTRDGQQAAFALAMIEVLGEWTVVTVGGRSFRVSRHCIALHGVRAADIDSYQFQELT